MTLPDNQYLCDSNNSVLVMIDIQPKLTAVMPTKVLARLQRNSGLLLRAAGPLQIPVIATEQYPKGLGKIEDEILKLMPDGSSCIEKTCFSCARVEEFRKTLEATGRKQVILLGMEAHICVYQTAIELLQDGYAVFVVIDGVCSRQRENYEASLTRLRQAGVVTCDTESVLFEWLRDASHPDFKTISSMLR
ncbi:MAG: hydrolase [Gammaproteobacteria bacterium]|nr:hydrolase [Gammaproteobacteria bacterium]